jgi:glycosyltransferase involved in cell wall biosynthesis
MKIAIVSLNLAPYFDPSPRARYGGAEVQAAFVARALREAGQDVRLVVADLPADIDIPYPTVNAFHARDGLPVLRFFHPRLSGVNDALEAVDADVYYQRNAGMVTGLAAHFCRRRGRVFVYGAGSDTDFSFRRVLIHGLRDRVMYHYGLRRVHGVVVQNNAQLRLAQGRVRAPARVIPNGVLPPARSSVSRNGTVMWAGGLRAVKRPDIFIELARRIPQRRFVIVGGGIGTEPDYAATIAKKAARVPNLTLTGWMPHAEVIREIERSVLVVNTSAVEGFPNVYLEAWNHGVPVVSFNDVDGLIAREGLGVLCTDIDDLERKTRALIEDHDRLNEMGERARRVVARRFSPAALGPSYVEFFETLRARNERSR